MVCACSVEDVLRIHRRGSGERRSGRGGAKQGRLPVQHSQLPEQLLRVSCAVCGSLLEANSLGFSPSQVVTGQRSGVSRT